VRDAFRRVAGAITTAVGTPWALFLAIAVIVAWAVSGPVFDFSDTWQLAINTGTTVVTFLMVFVIQASQNREARATQLKLDELIRAVRGARNEMIDLEDAPDEMVELHLEEFKHIVDAAKTTNPDVLDDVQVRRREQHRPAPRPAARKGSPG
jgi:low affinity Fe/Cu permease